MTAPATPRVSRAFVASCIALLTGCAAYAAALAWLPAAHFNGHYSPVGADSFYHARRILDAVANPGGFYEFDPRIHVPEGSWVTWPWAYDEGLAWVVRGLQQLTGSRDPMAILAFIPPSWVFVNAALLIAIGVTLGLRPAGLALAGAAFALSSLTQMLHAVGMIDHHYVEYTFVLATLLAGLRWLRDPARRAPAACLGAVLGIAPAFHNGLFALQIPVDAALFVLWLRGESPPVRAVAVLAAALVIGTLGAVVPSEPFRDGQFSLSTLSWFHLYVAALSAGGVWYLAARPCSVANFALFALLVAVALVPGAGEIVLGSRSLASGQLLVDTIPEEMSVWRQAQVFGVHGVLVTYSGWLVLLPLAAVACIVALVRSQTPPQWRFAAVFSLFGILLLATQARLHYFGSAVLFLFPALALQHLLVRLSPRAAVAVGGIALAGLAAAYVPVWKELWISPRGAWDFTGTYELYDRTIYRRLREACAQHPGTVLADNNYGHYIRFNTECSVISNPFILTPQHERKVAETQRLLRLPAKELAAQAPYVDYVLVIRAARNIGLTAELLSGDGPYAPGFELIAGVRDPDGKPAARAFRIHRPAAAPPGQ